jgi:hypothetical protein
MSQTTPDVGRIPAQVTLTKQGERYVTEPPPRLWRSRPRTIVPGSIGREIEELLRIRREADAKALRLIRLINLHDVDPDLEPEEDESDLDPDAEPDRLVDDHQPDCRRVLRGPRTEYDAEADDADDEDAGNDEPSLGAPEAFPGRMVIDGGAIWPEQTQIRNPGLDQSNWAKSGTQDPKDQHDGRESDAGGVADADGLAEAMGRTR